MIPADIKQYSEYIHVPSGGVYAVWCNTARMQLEDGEWVPAIVYQSKDTANIYVRSANSFCNSFTPNGRKP
jgi:hypothetical protein